MSTNANTPPADTPVINVSQMLRDNPDSPISLTLNAAEKFFTSFEKAARRWEMVVYPGMILLVLLMGYGFYLVFALSKDMQKIADKFDPNMGQHMSELSSNMKDLAQNIQTMSDNIDIMTIQVRSMSYSLKSVDIKMDYIKNMEGIATKMASMDKQMKYLKHMKAIDLQMAAMNRQMSVMTADISRMRFDFSNTTRPMSRMSNMMPF